MDAEMSSEIYTTEEIRKRLSPVFKRHNVRRAVLFGSYGKGKADVSSAVDKEIDVFDITHIDKGSKIEKEIEKTGVLLYEEWDYSVENAGICRKDFKVLPGDGLSGVY